MSYDKELEKIQPAIDLLIKKYNDNPDSFPFEPVYFDVPETDRDEFFKKVVSVIGDAVQPKGSTLVIFGKSPFFQKLLVNIGIVNENTFLESIN